MLRQAYNKKAMSRAKCFEWHSRFMSGIKRTSLNDDEKSGRPWRVLPLKMSKIFHELCVRIAELPSMKGQTVNAAFYCTVLR